jgi:hypothetical protein
MMPSRSRGPAAVLAIFLAALFTLASAAPSLHPRSRPKTGFAWSERSTIRESAWAWGSEAAVAVEGTRMYIPNGYPGLAAYDIADPAAPRLLFRLSSFELGGQAGAVAVKGSRVYVSLPDRGRIAVLEVDASGRPRLVAGFVSAPAVQHLEIRGTCLYIHTGSSFDFPGGVYLYDLTRNPPKPAGVYPAFLIDPGFTVSAEGAVLLARTPANAGAPAWIDIVDLSRPFRIGPLGRWSSPYPGNIVDLDLRDGSLYAAAYWGGLWALDAGDLSRTRLRARLDWEEPRFYALAAKAWPPYVVLGMGGPLPGDHKFIVLEETAAGFEAVAEAPAEANVHSIARYGRLCVLVELEPAGPNPNPQKILRIYEVLS